MSSPSPAHSARTPIFLRTEIRMGSPVAIAILFCSLLARSSWGRSATTGRHFSFIPFRNKGLMWSAMMAEADTAASRAIWLVGVTEFFQWSTTMNVFSPPPIYHSSISGTTTLGSATSCQRTTTQSDANKTIKELCSTLEDHGRRPTTVARQVLQRECRTRSARDRLR